MIRDKQNDRDSRESTDKESRFKRAFSSLWRYAVFFLLMSFVVTCCMLLFLEIVSGVRGEELTKEEIELAAKATFLNVILLSLICTVIDGIRRQFMVNRPVKRITSAAEKLMRGDLSVRIEPLKGQPAETGFNEIISYFNKAAEELSGIETLRTDFIANVSHELKTPLAVINNYGTILQQPELSDEKRIEYAKAVTDASRRLSELITNILKLNKLENQEICPAAEEFDLGEQLCECLLAYEEVWERKALEIETDIEDGVMVYADREMLSLVWNNLFSNAFKFTEKGGTVGLSVKAEGDLAVVRVFDTGCGISRETGEHIFEKFYQGDTSHSVKGNGLGLALVKRVIDIVKGEISVESELGKGSVFTVRIGRK
ncbi:MAG: HAMP domain-containing histidine kinase [Ruminococcaceae bacterium]|nr:HAMP domain-containing histidine kinase [Oscillospiraceae bacterium]